VQGPVGLARSTYRRLSASLTPADPDADMRALLPCLRPQTFVPWLSAGLGGVALRRAP
jgi:hypothetical protein